ncbi:TPA: NAD(P)-dependent oxidoreductase [Candidatus Woesearchaeota archaeon]|nr:NAD(P)-dependent oxidoreductase [Candidatus Woesearchaeota archaeon]
MSAILITGGTGFLGSRIAERLLAEGREVILYSTNRGKRRRVAHIEGRVQVYSSLSEVFARHTIAAIIHTATVYGKDEGLSDLISTNLLLPVMLAEKAMQHSVKLFVNIDTFLGAETNAYALSKKQLLPWLKMAKGSVSIVNLKTEMFYGEDDNPQRIIPSLIIKLLAEAEDIQLTSGEQVRDFIHVDDLAGLVCKVIAKAKAMSHGFYEYEVGYGSPLSIKELAQKLKKLTGNRSSRLSFGKIPYRKNELMHAAPNIAKAKKDFSWEPTTSLEEGLKKVIAWERRGRKDE